MFGGELYLAHNRLSNQSPVDNATALRVASRVSGDPYERVVINTRDIDMSLPIELDELSKGGVWPPVRMQERMTRQNLLRGVYEGDLSQIVDLNELADAGVTPTNHSRRIIGVQSNLMMRLPPEGSGVGLARCAHRALHDIGIHGAGFIEKVGEMWRCVDARRVWWTQTGEWVTVEPRVRMGSSTEINQPDSLMIQVFRDGMLTRWYQTISTYDIHRGGFIQITGDPTDIEDVGDACFGAAYRQPEIEQGYWGQPLILDILSLTSQYAVARARDTQVIEEHSRPLLILRGNVNPYVGGSEGMSLAGRRSGLGKLPSEIVQDATVTSRLRRHGVLPLTNGTEYAEYITWEGDLAASIQLQERIDMDMRLMSGVTAILGDNVELPSGMSLKRMFSVADAEAQSMRLPLLEALQECDSSVSWDDAFEETDQLNVEDVENEATARRGEATPDDRNER